MSEPRADAGLVWRLAAAAALAAGLSLAVRSVVRTRVTGDSLARRAAAMADLQKLEASEADALAVRRELEARPAGDGKPLADLAARAGTAPRPAVRGRAETVLDGGWKQVEAEATWAEADAAALAAVVAEAARARPPWRLVSYRADALSASGGTCTATLVFETVRREGAGAEAPR